MPRRRFLTSLLVFACLIGPAMMAAPPPADPDVEREFTESVKPFLNSYCTSCHSGERAAAQLDLRQYSSAESVVQDFSRWNRLREKLAAHQMPPKQAKVQPDERTRQQIINWIDTTWRSEARRNDGDPGVVLARRLSNAEYNYTIHDLTGVDIRPAREFPVDPANPAGFDNSGESLTMSPALLTKYLQAARTVADHMYLAVDGFEFAPHPMLVETDREKFCIQQIVDFYDRQVTDFAEYFHAAWLYKHRAVFGRPRATLADTAAANKVSARYLATIWDALEQKQDVGPLAKLQTMWHALPVPAQTAQPKLRPTDSKTNAAPQANHADLARKGTEAMRDFVVRMRKDTSLKFASPIVNGLSITTQPLMNWKNRMYATHRRDFDRAALRVEGEPPPVPVEMPDAKKGLIGTGANGEDLNAVRALAEQYQSRITNRDLEVPAGLRTRYETAFAKFSAIFPDTFYVRERGRFYPDDSEDKGRLLSAGFHNVMGYFRDDAPLSELLLDEHGQKQLEALWEEFEFVADFTARTYTEFFFNQSGEVLGNGRESGSHRPEDKAITESSVILEFKKTYLTKAAADEKTNPIAFDAITDHFDRVNATIRGIERKRLEAEPKHLDALLAFAARAYRRPLLPPERDDLLAFYRSLREKSDLSHEEAMRDLIVNVLMSPHFSYRVNAGSAERSPQPTMPLSDFALASRLSYFLWSTMPDDQLSAHAAAGDLRNVAVIVAEVRRMLKDGRARRLATEFGGNWLDFRRFDEHNAVDRERFPVFDNELREAMFEEPIRFISDVIRQDRSVLDMLYGNHTFVNPVLARHYGMPAVKGDPDEWVRIDNAREYQRGGLLPMAAFLTQNSPGLRTSPVKRGYWVARRVLGEVIPPPPPTVPELPKDEAQMDRSLREVLARHRENPACSGCHARFDSFGLTFEGYGPVGETRAKDLAGRPVDTNAAFPGGSSGSGVAGLQRYIRANREKDFLDNLCRKMLVYALGRSLMLSDEPLIQRMNAKLAASDYRFGTLVETIVTSPQFRNKRL
jgi:uncharacterized protein DUF1592/uncharacterized protein DUF1588/uncharacterized protein DUF1587/uncharacterized protein DUF1585/uncharacterized protein DUF1595